MASEIMGDTGWLPGAWASPRRSPSPGAPCWPSPSQASVDPGTRPGQPREQGMRSTAQNHAHTPHPRLGRVPATPPAPHIDVLLLLPVVLDEVAGGDVELLAVTLHLQDGALDVAQQLLVLPREGHARAREAAEKPRPPGALPPLRCQSRSGPRRCLCGRHPQWGSSPLFLRVRPRGQASASRLHADQPPAT